MITVSQIIQEYIQRTPFLEEGFSRGLLNYSAVAREMKPYIEKRLYKSVTVASIIMALKRLEGSVMAPGSSAQAELKEMRNITVRSNLIEYAFRTDSKLGSLHNYLLEQTLKQPDLFVSYTQGVSESTLIMSKILSGHIEEAGIGELIIEKVKNLSSITLRLRPEHLYVPGVHYAITKALAWEGINIVEIISSYSETTIVVGEKDVERAFSLIKGITNK